MARGEPQWHSYEGQQWETEHGSLYLERFLGAGAVTAVYRARWLPRGASQSLTVAVKWERTPHSREWEREKEALQRFEPRWGVGSSLPDCLRPLPRYLDQGTREGRRFLVTEYAEGWSVEEILSVHPDGRLPEPLVLYLLLTVAAAQAGAYEQGRPNADLQFKNLRWLARLHLPKDECPTEFSLISPEDIARARGRELGALVKDFLRWWATLTRQTRASGGRAIVVRYLDWNTLEERIPPGQLQKDFKILGGWAVRMLTGRETASLFPENAPDRLEAWLREAGVTWGTRELVLHLFHPPESNWPESVRITRELIHPLHYLLDAWSREPAALEALVTQKQEAIASATSAEEREKASWEHAAALAILGRRQGKTEEPELSPLAHRSIQAIRNLTLLLRRYEEAREQVQALLTKPIWQHEVTLHRWQALLKAAPRLEHPQVERIFTYIEILHTNLNKALASINSEDLQEIPSLKQEYDLLRLWQEVSRYLERARDREIHYPWLHESLQRMTVLLNELLWKETYAPWLKRVRLPALETLKAQVEALEEATRLVDALQEGDLRQSIEEAERFAQKYRQFPELVRWLGDELWRTFEAQRDRLSETEQETFCRAILHNASLSVEVRHRARELLYHIQARKRLDALFSPDAGEEAVHAFLRALSLLPSKRRQALLQEFYNVWRQGLAALEQRLTQETQKVGRGVEQTHRELEQTLREQLDELQRRVEAEIRWTIEQTTQGMETQPQDREGQPWAEMQKRFQEMQEGISQVKHEFFNVVSQLYLATIDAQLEAEVLRPIASSSARAPQELNSLRNQCSRWMVLLERLGEHFQNIGGPLGQALEQRRLFLAEVVSPLLHLLKRPPNQRDRQQIEKIQQSFQKFQPTTTSAIPSSWISTLQDLVAKIEKRPSPASSPTGVFPKVGNVLSKLWFPATLLFMVILLMVLVISSFAFYGEMKRSIGGVRNSVAQQSTLLQNLQTSVNAMATRIAPQAGIVPQGAFGPTPTPTPTVTPTLTPTFTPAPTPTPIPMSLAVAPTFLDVPQGCRSEGLILRWFTLPRLEVVLPATCRLEVPPTSTPSGNGEKQAFYSYQPQEEVRLRCEAGTETLFLSVQVQPPASQAWMTVRGEVRVVPVQAGEGAAPTPPPTPSPASLTLRWHPLVAWKEGRKTLALVFLPVKGDGKSLLELRPKQEVPFRLVLVEAAHPERARYVLARGRLQVLAPPPAGWFPEALKHEQPAPTPAGFDLRETFVLNPSKIQASAWLERPDAAYRVCCLAQEEGMNHVYVLVQRPQGWVVWLQAVSGQIHADMYNTLKNARLCSEK